MVLATVGEPDRSKRAGAQRHDTQGDVEARFHFVGDEVEHPQGHDRVDGVEPDGAGQAILQPTRPRDANSMETAQVTSTE